MPQEDRRYFKQQEIEMFRAPPQTGGDRGAVGAASPLHLSRGAAGAPSADAEAEAAGSGILPALLTCVIDRKSFQSSKLLAL